MLDIRQAANGKTQAKQRHSLSAAACGPPRLARFRKLAAPPPPLMVPLPT